MVINGMKGVMLSGYKLCLMKRMVEWRECCGEFCGAFVSFCVCARVRND